MRVRVNFAPRDSRILTVRNYELLCCIMAGEWLQVAVALVDAACSSLNLEIAGPLSLS